MFSVAGLLIYLAIAKEYEPTLLLPIGFGALLGNLPNSPLNEPGGLLYILNEFGIKTELFPLFIFIGIGALMDFRPLLSQPFFALMGAAGQLGIFGTLILATRIGFPLNQAASIAIIGAIDGPTSIYVSSQLAPELLAPIAVAAYSYMSLVPIIQPPLMRLLTTTSRAAHPHGVHAAAGAARGRHRVSDRGDRRRRPARAAVRTAGLHADVRQPAEGVRRRSAAVVRGGERDHQRLHVVSRADHRQPDAGRIVSADADAVPFCCSVSGAFVFDTVAGLLFGKLLAVVSRGRVNPLVGAAGISAFPMSGRIVQKMAQEEDFTNHVLMHAMGANTAGQLGSVIAGGILLALVGRALAGPRRRSSSRPLLAEVPVGRRPGGPAITMRFGQPANLAFAETQIVQDGAAVLAIARGRRQRSAPGVSER